ncbi:MAG: acetyl-CoA acyltransferase [Chloroflexi bacterium]|jgi:acetyl-CoA acyltransferase|nr:MAG: acetyl-CoA acyltransferase [Chloroflexota bacterium]
MREAVIVDSLRTGLGKSFKGALNATRPDDMLAHVMKASLAKYPQIDLETINDVVIGCAFPEGAQGLNIARISSMLAGIPASVPAQTVNRFCSSGSQAISTAAEQILSGGQDIVLAGGVETISMIDDGSRNTNHMINPIVKEQYPSLYWVMGRTAEVVAERYGISRQVQDEYALLSQLRTAAAQENNIFSDEIIPIKVTKNVFPKDGEKYTEELILESDECNRPDTTIDALSQLNSVFTKDGSGSVTAGNSSQFSDGASVTIMMSSEKAKQLNIEPLGIYRGTSVIGLDPDEMGLGPMKAVPKLLELTGKKLSNIDLWELNEAFAVQVVHCMNELGIDQDKINVNGGAISIGHPYGVTGSRTTGHLLRELRRKNQRWGIVTMCVGGGQGFASLFEAN